MCPPLLSLPQEVPSDQSLDDVIGRPMPHLAAAKQATGEALYCDDIPKYEGKLQEGESARTVIIC